MSMKKLLLFFVMVSGIVSVTIGILAPIRAETNYIVNNLATAPLAIPRGGVMACTVANVSNTEIKINIRQFQHFRFNPSLPNDPFLIEKTEILKPNQATSVAATVGSDSAIGRCTFEFKGPKESVRAAGVVLEDATFESVNGGFIVRVRDGKPIAVVQAE